MTQDQHKNILLIYYEDSVRNTIDYLKTKYSLIDCTRDDDDVPKIVQLSDKYSNFYKVNVNCLSKTFTLILAFQKSFPDASPKTFLSVKDFEEIYPIPHLDNSRVICTRDSEVIVLNDNKPGEAVEELIEIAREVLEKGLKKENEEDFIKEFLAYWNDGKKYTFLSLFEPVDNCEKLYLFKLSDKLFGHGLILSGSEEKLLKWLTPFNVKAENTKIGALYLPLSEFHPFSLNVNYDLLETLTNGPNKKHIGDVENFFNQNKRNRIIVSSFLIDKERILFGWSHKRGTVKQFRGFRNGNVPLNIRFSDHKNRNVPIEKIEIIRLDKGRIFKRGGTIKPFLKKDVDVTLVGCGSLGSYLLMSLSRCGISNFTIIDNDDLRPENTPRHLCGFLEASKGMNRLTEHFPHLKIETYDSDFLQLFLEEKINLEKCDLLIIAIGKMSVERRINFLQRKGEIGCPVVYLWIEPFGVGGHILFVHPNEPGCYECCFDNNGIFKYSITRSDEEFQKRESGCQSTFIPYSSLQIDQFINVACKKILTTLDKGLRESILFTWIGDIEEFEDMKFKISSMYATKSPYSIIERKILSQETCKICVKEELGI